MNKKTVEMRIEKIQKVETHTKNTDKELWKIEAKDTDRVTTMVLTTPTQPSGFKPYDVIDITVANSQTSLEEFEKKAENYKEEDSDDE